MEKKEAMFTNANVKIKEMEEVSRMHGISSIVEPKRLRRFRVTSNPEVPEKPVRRKYTVEYKRRILKEAEFCKEAGQVGTLLRREGLYSSNLTAWRRQMERGTLEALSPKKRGPKEKKLDPSFRQIAQLEKENQRLRHKLRQAEIIIDAQKKIAEIFQAPLDQKEEENS